MRGERSVSSLRMIANIYGLLTGREKRKVFWLFLLDMGAVASSLIGIGALLPYIYLIFTPGKETGLSRMLVLSAVLLIIYALRCVYVVFYQYVSTKILTDMVNQYSIDLFCYYLTRPGEYYFERNTAQMQYHYSSAAANLLNGVLVAVIELLAAAVKAVCLVVFLFALKCQLAILPVLLLIVLNGFFYLATGRRTRRLSAQMNEAAKQMLRDSLESFRMISELQLFAKTDAAVKRQERERREVRDIQIRRNLLIQVPDGIMDFFTLALLLAILVIQYAATGDVLSSLAILSVSVVCAFELRDTVFSVFDVVNGVRQNAGQYEDAYRDMSAAVRAARQKKEGGEKEKKARFEREIALADVSYRYPGTSQFVLDKMTLTIRRGDFVGVSGPSGAGKTTFVKALLGILPAQGQITADGAAYDRESAAWRSLFGVVPQDVVLMEGTIAQNVAMDYRAEQIDEDKAVRALAAARLSDFVAALPQGIHTPVGENGSLLSGGQRQRIGIARALYREPEVLIFDEATSALDYETERTLLETVSRLKGMFTILFITHRKESLRMCDWVIEMGEEAGLAPRTDSGEQR